MAEKKFNERRKRHPMSRLLEKNYNTRFKLSIFVLTIFILVVAGVTIAIYSSATLDQEWKEILLLLLGAFIGSYSRVIDFWFNNAEKDKELIARADHEDNGLTIDTIVKPVVAPIVSEPCNTPEVEVEVDLEEDDLP